jgi:hypothetical protein
MVWAVRSVVSLGTVFFNTFNTEHLIIIYFGSILAWENLYAVLTFLTGWIWDTFVVNFIINFAWNIIFELELTALIWLKVAWLGLFTPFVNVTIAVRSFWVKVLEALLNSAFFCILIIKDLPVTRRTLLNH